MRERGWRVVRVELEPRFKSEVVADLRAWSWSGERPDFIWSSPPCTEFSRNSLPWCHHRECVGTVQPCGHKAAPSLQLVQACIRVIQECRPRWWCIENVRGAVKWFRPLLGAPIYRTGPIRLWGALPALCAMPKVRAYKVRISGKRPDLRSLIPAEVSAAVADSIELALRSCAPAAPVLRAVGGGER